MGKGLRRNFLFLTFLVLLLIGAVGQLALTEPSQPPADNPEPKASQTEANEESAEQPSDQLAEEIKKTGFKRIGVALFENVSRVKEGDRRLSRRIYNYLKAKVPSVEFVKVARDLDPDEPILLSEARYLGEKYGVEAIIYGTLIRIQIPTGTFPSRANRRPMARAEAVIRVVETKQGLPLVTYLIYDEGMRFYDWRIATKEDLEDAVISYIADTAYKVLKDEGIFFGVEPDLKARDERRKQQAELKEKLRKLSQKKKRPPYREGEEPF